MESIDDLLKQDLSPEDLEKLTPVVKHSIFLRNRIKANKDLIALALTKESTPRTKDLILKELMQSDIFEMNEHQFMHFLRFYKYVEYILIAIEELYYNKDVKETTSHLSAFASAMLEIAYRYAHNELVAKYGLPLDDEGKQVNFAIIGLGKLGGWELNFSSDIDLIYVYDTEKGKTEGGKGKTQISNHEFFVKLGGKIKYYLSELTPDGFVYRVDLRLRPDGDRGPLAMPLRSYETYYESYGQSWERMMLLKGTIVAGDKEVGEKFLLSVKPFIFRRSIDYKLINDLLDVKGKIASRVRLKGDKKDVKLGYGGIREIEFIVQAIQILNYPKNPDVYHKNTLESIDSLTHFGLLSREEGEILSTSYRFLRKLEHMAQIENEQQTHTIPETSERFDLYIERCGFANADVFYKRYEEVTNNVNKIFNSIISEEKPSLAKILADEELEIEDLKECFLMMGFSNPETVAEITRKIVSRKGGRLLGQSETNLLFKLLEIILKEIKDIKNPEKVLNFFDRFFMRPDAVYLFYDIFASAPQILKKLVSIIDYSNYLPGLILQNRNLLDYIYDPKNSNYRSEDILEIFKNDISRTDNEEFEYNLTRRKFQELFFNVAYAYLNSEINVVKCCKSLTELAKGVLNFAFQREYERLLPKMGTPLNKSGNKCDYLILGMGKLGSGEISFGSDLDIIVLYEEEGHTDKGDKTNQEFFSKLVQRVISYLATPTVYGILYTIDMRLRPSGAKGALVTTFKSFSEYQYKKAMLWEKQALLRAGVINQESTMKEMFERLVTDVIFAKSIEAKQVEEIYDMRMRIQREKGEPYEINDIKAGFGGIIDVEFAIQMIQLKYGKDFPALRQKNSHDLLHAMLQAGIIKNRDYYALHNNYLFFRNVENIMRVYENKAISRLPKNQDLLEKIARFLNFKNTEKLLTQINEGRKTVRNAFNRIFEQEKSTGIV